ncbi:hypothetical protein N9818_00285 [Arcobacteraceae bacterium]|nr:hypothetical protein [Arcobacteraceae bacterium]
MKLFKLKMITVIYLGLGIGLLAEGNIEDYKSKMVSNIDKRISILTNTKKCVESATEKTDLKNCRK